MKATGKVAFVDLLTPYNWNIKFNEENGLYQFFDDHEYCLSISMGKPFIRDEKSRYITMLRTKNILKTSYKRDSYCSFFKIEKKDKGYWIIFQRPDKD